MFCIALVLLLQCLFGSCGYTFKARGQDFVQVDLFEGLHWRNSSYQGLQLGKGFDTLSPALIFSGEFRELLISEDWVNRIRDRFSHLEVSEFTISAIVQQKPNNVGTLLTFSTGLINALEIQSSGRKDELRVISDRTIETFPFRLADGSWHRLAISFSASQVDILVDCNLIYRRVLGFDPSAMIFNSRNISVWIGQRAHSQFLYQGVMQDLRLTFGPYGYLSKCPRVDSQCPTCSEYKALKLSFASLQSQIQLLTERLQQAESRLTNVEQCDCQKPCRVNETTVFNDGTSWRDKCQVCSCKRGEVLCQPVECPKLNCKNPIPLPGECCPTCLKQCFFRGRTYDHGEVESGRNIPMPVCTECECVDGTMQCKNRDPQKTCPTLPCPVSEQIVVSEQCCKVCPGTDYCALHKNQCHPNATCVNLQTTFACQCDEGFSGDGVTNCEDLDECLLDRNHCARNSICVNRQGSYDCECGQGYKKIDKFQCKDIDECTEGSHKCHPYATCTNVIGSYICMCREGYSGDGIHCSPICNRTCENGGLCIAPDVCSCGSGWTGEQCERDVDECSLERQLCPQNADCVNKPGWNYCECKQGFRGVNIDGEAKCQDINECEEREDACDEGLTCINTEGSYKCRCPEGDHECSKGCVDNFTVHTLGSTWDSEDCLLCTCDSPGTALCQNDLNKFCANFCTEKSSEARPCCDRCKNSTIALASTKGKSCSHQLYSDIQYQSGETWYSQCQTCECMDGEIDCWQMECPPVNCHNPFRPVGDCCLRCPSEDKCTHTLKNGTFAECRVLEDTIESGTRVTLPHSHCFSCRCQDGELCCSYDFDCVAHESDYVFLTPQTQARPHGGPLGL